MKMLVTDLDNTLYDWVTFFSLSFDSMVNELSDLIDVDRERLLDEFKAVHQFYGNTEQPFAILEIPSIKEKYKELSRLELMQLLKKPLHAFNSTRKKYLRLYDSVETTLEVLSNNGFVIIGYTEAIAENGFYRLLKLDILKYFTRLYALESNYLGHPNKDRQNELLPPEDFIRLIPKHERKPNPILLKDICNREGIEKENTWYIGDSLIRDVSMANEAGVKSIWAKYGTRYDKKLWDTLVRVTHWQPEDIEREESLRMKYNMVKPDCEIENFEEIIKIVGLI